MSLSLCIKINANPFNRSSSIVDRRRDFKIFMALKHRSAEQEVSGIVTAMRSSFRTFGKRPGAVVSASSMDWDWKVFSEGSSSVASSSSLDAVSSCSSLSARSSEDVGGNL